MSVRVLLGRYAVARWASEGSMGHEDDRLVGGGRVSGDSYYAVSHLVDIHL